KAYGDFNFLSNFFAQVMSFLDMGTSTCFYTRLSQRQKEPGLVSFYFRFSAAVAVLMLVAVFAMHISGLFVHVWPAQVPMFIYFAAIWAFLSWFMQILNQMTDAYGLTVPAEVARLMQRILGAGVIVGLYLACSLRLTTYFFYYFVMLLALVAVLLRILRPRMPSSSDEWKLSGDKARGYMKEFYAYTQPLFVYSAVSLVVNLLDRWLLQFYGGSVQQGFFGLSFQIATVCLLFTTAMTPLLMREFSIAAGNADVDRMRRLFRRWVPLFFSLAAFFACFVAVQPGNVVHLLGGRGYTEAVTAVSVMAFYPVYQTYGQLSASVFLAAGRTRLYRNIGIPTLLLGLPVTYLLIAPRTAFGLDAGALGLAIKTVGIAFLSVNVMLFFVARVLGLNFWKFVAQQMAALGTLSALAGIVTIGAAHVPWLNGRLVTTFVVSGIVYSLVAICVGLVLPRVFGLNREDIKSFYSALLGRFRRSAN
ncbi:MAG: lipopolysaccharide biosynthesis protein, partial [Planctomycetota bacterium]|nr:lipopolysaccharide biosynthesis protein [Planctomycetota bacterium]